MAALVALMFASVIATAILLRPDLGDVATGLLVPRIPDLRGDGLTWTVALMGGVGGTLRVANHVRIMAGIRFLHISDSNIKGGGGGFNGLMFCAGTMFPF